MNQLTLVFLLLSWSMAIPGVAQATITVTNAVFQLWDPNFGAQLDGAHADPANQSPWTATASLSLSPANSSWLPPNHLDVDVYFPHAVYLTDPDVGYFVVTIEQEDGIIVTNSDGPVILRGLPPTIPGFPPGVKVCVLTPSGFYCPLPTDYVIDFVINELQIMELLTGQWYVHVKAFLADGTALGGYDIRGRILALDSDSDGIMDYLDQCPDTPLGSIVDAQGCSLEQVCPCDGSWKNHGEYIECAKIVTEQFLNSRLITASQRREFLNQADHSDCGKPREHK